MRPLFGTPLVPHLGYLGYKHKSTPLLGYPRDQIIIPILTYIFQILSWMVWALLPVWTLGARGASSINIIELTSAKLGLGWSWGWAWQQNLNLGHALAFTCEHILNPFSPTATCLFRGGLNKLSGICARIMKGVKWFWIYSTHISNPNVPEYFRQVRHHLPGYFGK